MKQKAIQLLKTETQPVALYNGLLSILISSQGNPNLIRNYNVRGYSAQSLETLKYDIIQHLGITMGEMTSSNQQFAIRSTRLANCEKQKANGGQPTITISTQYPFLRDENCPNEFKILVNDAISAFHRFKEKHEDLFRLSQSTEGVEPTAESLYNIASELLKDFEINRGIHQELEYFAKEGEILGKHKIFSELKLKREIDAMSADELAKAKNNLKANISKKKKALSSIQQSEESSERIASFEEQIAYLEKKRDLVDARLKEK